MPTEQLAEPERYDAGVANFERRLAEARRQNLKPPPKLTLSQWADTYAHLSRETSAETGRFRAFPYQVGMMDAVTDPSVWKITVKKSARVGYTKILDHVVGYYIHQDPSPILIYQPSEEDADEYDADEIEPMVRDTPVLAELAGALTAKSSKQKKGKRSFRNGATLTIRGANAPRGFRRITARIVAFDEVDGYPKQGAGKEGDQLKLGTKRSETFWNRKVIIGSTPTEQGASRIDTSWSTSDQRRYFVPCPRCGVFQVLEWGGKDTPYGIKWERDDAGRGLPETAHYVCRHCAGRIDETEKPDMVAAGEWRATAPGPFRGHAGFHIWAGYSLFPNASWARLVEEWIDCQGDPLAVQTFVNLALGEVFADRGLNALSEELLLERRELFAAEVPDGAAVLTLGVDTQDDRYEYEVVAWGRDEESWSIEVGVIDGDPADPETERRLDALTRRTWVRADGRPFGIEAGCIDSGGHRTDAVYAFSKARLGRKIWATKGESGRGGQRNPLWPVKTPSRRTKKSFRPVMLGVNAGKDDVRAALRIEAPGPRYMHVPLDRDLVWFQQLLAERLVQKRANGAVWWVWEQLPGRANEALDCRVYALAALRGLMHRGLRLNQRADRVGAAVTEVQPEVIEGEAPAEVMNAVSQANPATAVEIRRPGTPAPSVAAASAPAPAPASQPARPKAVTSDKAARLAARLARMK